MLFRHDPDGALVQVSNTSTAADPSAQGTFAFYNLADGDYTLCFQRGWGPEFGSTWTSEFWNGKSTLETADTFRVASGAVSTIEATLSPPTPVLTGRITDQNGNPVAGVGVLAYEQSPYYWMMWSMAAGTSTDANGVYNFWELNPQGYKLQFSKTWPSGFGQTSTNVYWSGKTDLDTADFVYVAEGQTQTANATMARPELSIQGRVTDAEGNPLSDVEVTLLGGGDPYREPTNTGQDPEGQGRYQFWNIAPGEYTLKFTRYWEVDGVGHSKTQYYHGKYTPGMADPVTVVAGSSTTADEVLTPPSRSIAGHVTDQAAAPLSGVDVLLFRVGSYDSPYLETMTDADGNYELWSVMPGAYVVGFRRQWPDPSGIGLQIWGIEYWSGKLAPELAQIRSPSQKARWRPPTPHSVRLRRPPTTTSTTRGPCRAARASYRRTSWGRPSRLAIRSKVRPCGTAGSRRQTRVSTSCRREIASVRGSRSVRARTTPT